MLGGAARGQDWTLTTADFKSEPVTLKSIDDSGVRVVRAQSEERVVPADSFLQLDRSRGAGVPTGKFMLHMSGGDLLGGEPLGIKNDQISWQSAAIGEIQVPLSRLVAITKPGQQPPDLKRTEDTVKLVNGDTVRGIIAGMEEGKISVKAESGDVQAVPIDSIASVWFAAAAGAKAAGERGYRVRLDDGSSIVGPKLKLDGAKLDLTLGKDNLRSIDLSRVTGIEQVNGPVSFLTSRTPSESVYIPFLGEPSSLVRIDRSVSGGELMCGGRVFRRGIGVHSFSRLSYPLDGNAAAFRTQYGINDDCPRGDVTVRILLDGKLVHEQPKVRAGTLWPVVTIDLGAAKKLTLEVDYGNGKHVDDHLDWIEPALLREKPPEQIPATMPSTAPATEPTAAPGGPIPS